MIIDSILSRRDGSAPFLSHDGKTLLYYSPKAFYDDVSKSPFTDITHPIMDALDCGEEGDVKRELCRYVDEQGYDPSIKDFIMSVDWL